jgi:hypothetical protein
MYTWTNGKRYLETRVFCLIKHKSKFYDSKIDRSSQSGSLLDVLFSQDNSRGSSVLNEDHRGSQPQNYFPITTDTRLVGYICSRLAPWLRGTPVFPGCIFYPADRFIAGMVIRPRQLLPRFYCFYFVYLENHVPSIVTATLRDSRMRVGALSNCSITNRSTRRITFCERY